MMLKINPPRRDFHNVIGSLINALGGYKVVAGLCMTSADNVNKWKQNPSGNGQVIPLIHFQTLLAEAGNQLTNLAAQNAVDEILMDHFLNLCHRVAYPQERVFEFVEMLQGKHPVREPEKGAVN